MKKLKKVGLGIGIAFAILIILGAIGGSLSNDTSSQQNTSTQPAEKIIPVGDKKNPAKVGDIVVAGDIAYVIDSTFVTSSVGNEVFGSKADGIFVVVNMDMENKGKESVQIISDYFKLIDSQGREFETDNEAWIHLEKNVFLKQLQPGLPTKGQVVFDIPTTSESYTLEISGGLVSFDKEYVLLGKLND